MTVAEDLLRRHIETLVADNARWQTMLADDVVWELPFALAIGRPARVSGRAEVVQFAAWFVGAVESFRFFDVRVQAFADSEAAVAEVKVEGRITEHNAVIALGRGPAGQQGGGEPTWLFPSTAKIPLEYSKAAKAFDTPMRRSTSWAGRGSSLSRGG
jgi:hypothetical protein